MLFLAALNLKTTICFYPFFLIPPPIFAIKYFWVMKSSKKKKKKKMMPPPHFTFSFIFPPAHPQSNFPSSFFFLKPSTLQL